MRRPDQLACACAPHDLHNGAGFTDVIRRLQLLDYDDPESWAATQRAGVSGSPSKSRRSSAGQPASAITFVHTQLPQPPVSKSGRKRTLTLRAELAAAADALELGVASPDAVPPATRPAPKAVAPRATGIARGQTCRPVIVRKEPPLMKCQGKKSGPDVVTNLKAAPRVRVQPALQSASGNGALAPSAAVEVWCENINNLAPGGCIGKKYATDASVRNQVMSDLLCVYFAIFRTDVSENLMQHFRLLGNVADASGADLTRPPPQSTNAAVKELSSAVATLRYTKHFEKDYGGAHPHPSRPVCLSVLNECLLCSPEGMPCMHGVQTGLTCFCLRPGSKYKFKAFKEENCSHIQ